MPKQRVPTQPEPTSVTLTSSVGPPLIAALMRMPVDASRARMLATLHEHGFTDLVPAHLIVLRYPGPDGRRPIEIAAQSGITKQALNYLLGQLERLGYLRRESDPDQGRAKRVRTTKRGDQAIQLMRASVGSLEREFAEAYGEEDLESLRRLLIQLNVMLAQPARSSA